MNQAQAELKMVPSKTGAEESMWQQPLKTPTGVAHQWIHPPPPPPPPPPDLNRSRKIAQKLGTILKGAKYRLMYCRPTWKQHSHSVGGNRGRGPGRRTHCLLWLFCIHSTCKVLVVVILHPATHMQVHYFTWLTAGCVGLYFQHVLMLFPLANSNRKPTKEQHIYPKDGSKKRRCANNLCCHLQTKETYCAEDTVLAGIQKHTQICQSKARWKEKQSGSRWIKQQLGKQLIKAENITESFWNVNYVPCWQVVTAPINGLNVNVGKNRLVNGK